MSNRFYKSFDGILFEFNSFGEAIKFWFERAIGIALGNIIFFGILALIIYFFFWDK
jgi:hypothetical protein